MEGLTKDNLREFFETYPDPKEKINQLLNSSPINGLFAGFSPDEIVEIITWTKELKVEFEEKAEA